MQPIIFHIDVNSAFLSWSAVEKRKTDTSFDLRDIPSIVGGDQTSRHGVVLAKSIPAKAFGIKTGEPISHALRKCPQLYIEPAMHKMYQSYSKQMFDFLYTFTSDIEKLSIDECFMDFTPIAKKYDSYLSCAVQIKEGIKKQFGFTVNVGISSNRLLAKMASDFLKPDKIHTLFPNEIEKKMWPLPVDDLYMVGKASASRLHSVGIHTIGDLAKTDSNYLSLEFKSHGRKMWEYANGIDSSIVSPKSAPAKGIGNSTTLSKDVSTKEEAFFILLSLCESVTRRLRSAHQLAQSLTVEIKYSDFSTCSHQMSLFAPTDSTDLIYNCSCQLFLELWNQSPIRLLGVRATKLIASNAPMQMTLFDYQNVSTSPSFHTNSRFNLNAPSSTLNHHSLGNLGNSTLPNDTLSNHTFSDATLSNHTFSDTTLNNHALNNDHLMSHIKSDENLKKGSTQKKISHKSIQQLHQLDQALDSIREKYGSKAVVRGSLLKKEPPDS